MKKQILSIAKFLSFFWLIVPFKIRKTLFTSFFILESRTSFPDKDLKKLFLIKDNLDWVINERALKYGQGIHPKHKLTNYHQFFIDRISDGMKVLDVGCGNGAVAIDIAKKLKKASIVGVDLNRNNIKMAKKLARNYKLDNINFIFGDINNHKKISADVVILSNILEHISERVSFLENIKKISSAKKILIRVPNFQRDWQLALRKELGIYYFSDIDHKIEHTIEEFKSELLEADLEILELISIWGEIWANCK